MDPLSDLLRVVRLNGAFFYMVDASPPWSVAAGEARHLIPIILPSAEHLMAYHVLTEGNCWAGLEGAEQVRMQPGDVIVFPHGDAHFVSSARGKRADSQRHGEVPLAYPEVVRIGEGARESRFVCGFLGIDVRPFNPLLSALPRMLHVPRMAGGWLSSFPEHAVHESRTGRAGAETMLKRMMEMMFIEVVRNYVESLGDEQVGWLAALRDPAISKVLALLHERPSHDWSLDELARGASMSRSVLAERFAKVVGIPPMQYLSQWRLQLAADLLARGVTKVSAVGTQVGYESEAAFSRAFKRETGESPSAWRKRRLGA